MTIYKTDEICSKLDMTIFYILSMIFVGWMGLNALDEGQKENNAQKKLLGVVNILISFYFLTLII